MNGIGWVCDECGKTEVVTGDWFTQRGPGAPPTGWYLLFKAAPDQAQENERWEFCSVECVHSQTDSPCGQPEPEASVTARSDSDGSGVGE